MARVELVVTDISRSGAWVAPVAGTADGHQFDNDGRVFLYVVNAVGAARDLTIVTPKEVIGLDVEDLVIHFLASETKLIGPFPPSEFNNVGALSGVTYVNFPAGSEASFTVAAYSF